LQGCCKRLSEVGKQNVSFHVRYQMAHGYLYSHELYKTCLEIRLLAHC